MNLVLLQPEEVAAGEIVDPSRLRHLKEEHELQTGLKVTAGIWNGQIGSLQIESLSDERLVFSFEPARAPPPRLPLRLAVAFARPQIAKRVIQFSACAGVSELIFFQSSQANASYHMSKAYTPKEVEYNILLGLEQGMDTRAPTITFKHHFSSFLKLAQSFGSSIVVADQRGASGAFPKETGTLYVVGPEAGFSENELEALTGVGAQLVSFGPRTFRVDVALNFIIGNNLLNP